MVECPYQTRSGRSDLESMILVGGIFYLGYLVLKSWGVIKPTASMSGTKLIGTYNWKPLSNNEIMNVRNYINNYNPIQLVRES